MKEDRRDYSDEEFARILEKAEELAEGSRDQASSFSLEEMKTAAEEAGLDPALVERAARLTQRDRKSSWVHGLLRAVGWNSLRADLPTPLTQERADHLLSTIRAIGGVGRGEATSSGLHWRNGLGRVSVAMHNDGVGTRVRVSSDPWTALLLGGWFGVIAVWTTLGMLEPISGIKFLGSVAAGLGVAIGTWAPMAIRDRKLVADLVDMISQPMHEVGGVPSVSAGEIDTEAGAESRSPSD